MRTAIAITVAAALLTSCAARRAIDSDAAGDILLQAMVADGLKYPRFAGEPQILERGGSAEMQCAVQYLSADQRQVTQMVRATFTESGDRVALKTYEFLPGSDAFNEPAVQR